MERVEAAKRTRRVSPRNKQRGLVAQDGETMPLRAVRKATGLTQVDVANVSGISQGDVSRLEHRGSFDECQIATLRRYVEAMGGELLLVACFGNTEITLAAAEES